MIVAVRYTSDMSCQWDDFVKASKNGTFLFLRGYMDYHSDRFTDHSLMFFDEHDRLVALLPANEYGDCLYSHQGLTYGGFVLSFRASLAIVGTLFEAVFRHMSECGFRELRYKQVPGIYHKCPAEEDTYWLWRYGATIESCNVMTAIDLQAPPLVSPRKRTYQNKLRRQGYTIDMRTPMGVFWPVLEENLLLTYGASPVHTLSEMERLAKTFPDHIQCAVAFSPSQTVVAGTVLYTSDNVTRTQYIAASPEGKRCNAADYLLLSVADACRDGGRQRYLEFGTSMESDGINVSDGLVRQKESYGGRSIACRTYSVKYPS